MASFALLANGGNERDKDVDVRDDDVADEDEEGVKSGEVDVVCDARESWGRIEGMPCLGKTDMEAAGALLDNETESFPLKASALT